MTSPVVMMSQLRITSLCALCMFHSYINRILLVLPQGVVTININSKLNFLYIMKSFIKSSCTSSSSTRYLLKKRPLAPAPAVLQAISLHPREVTLAGDPDLQKYSGVARSKWRKLPRNPCLEGSCDAWRSDINYNSWQCHRRWSLIKNEHKLISDLAASWFCQ